MNILGFCEEFEDALHFVEWLNEQAARPQPLMDVRVYSKHERDDATRVTVTFNIESLVYELRTALEALAKIKATASLSQDLNQ